MSNRDLKEKHSLSTPIPKNKDFKDFSDLTPISILCGFSKLVEQFIEFNLDFCE